MVVLNLSINCSVWVRSVLNKHRYWWDAQHGCLASCKMKCEQGVGMFWQPAVTFFMSASLVSYAMQKVVSFSESVHALLVNTRRISIIMNMHSFHCNVKTVCTSAAA